MKKKKKKRQENKREMAVNVTFPHVLMPPTI